MKTKFNELIDKLSLDITKPVILADQYGIVFYINALFESAFGWTEQDIVHKPLLRIIPEHLHDAHNVGFSRFITTEIPMILKKSLKLEIVTKQGDILTSTHFICAVKENDDWIFGANIELIIM